MRNEQREALRAEMRRAKWVAIGLIAIVLAVGCDRAPATSPLLPQRPSLTSDPGYNGEGCYPISAVCQDSALDAAGVTRAYGAINGFYFNSYNDTDCSNIINMVFDRLGSGNVRFWTNPPDTNTSGDSHRTITPQLIHITQNAWAKGDEEIARTGFTKPRIWWVSTIRPPTTSKTHACRAEAAPR